MTLIFNTVLIYKKSMSMGAGVGTRFFHVEADVQDMHVSILSYILCGMEDFYIFFIRSFYSFEFNRKKLG